MNGQTEITGDVKGIGRIDGQQCDWCPEPAATSHEFQRNIKGGKGQAVGDGTFAYACPAHKETAERLTKVAKPSRIRK